MATCHCIFVEDKNRYRFVVQSLVILVRSCIGLIWASAGPLVPLIMGAYGLSRGSAGWFASVAPLTIAAVSLPVGMFASRYSLKKTFAVGAFLQAGGILALFADSYFLILLTRAAFAAGTAITVPVATAIASEWFSSRKLPVVNGVTMSIVTVGNAVAFLATVPIATVLSWKAPIVIYGAVALTCAVAWTVFGKDRPKGGLRPETFGDPVLDKRPHLGLREVLSQRSTLLLAFAVMGAWSLGNAMGSWLPSYYNEVFGMPLTKASSILALTTVGGTVACLVGGFISVRLGLRKPLLTISGMFIGLSAISAVLFNNLYVIYGSVAIFGILGGLQVSSLFTIPMELPNMSVRSGVIVISVMQVGGNLGNFLSPLIVGYLADVTGSYLPGFIMFSVFSLSLLVAGLLLPETGPKARTLARAKPAPQVALAK